MSDRIKDFNGNIKSTKVKRFSFKLFKKMLLGLLAASIVLGSSLGFAGCKKKTKPAPERPSISQSVEISSSTNSATNSSADTSTSISQEEVKQTYFSEFITEYREEAQAFAQDNFKEIFTEGRETLSEDWAFTSNDLGEITSIKLNYTYAGEDNMRVRENVELIFAFPLDIDKILDGELTNLDLSGVTYRNEIFSWDAKQNFCQDDLRVALTEACGVEGTSYFREIESADETKKAYEVAISNDENKTIVYSIEVENADSIEEIIANLADSEKTEVSKKEHFSLGNHQIDVNTYTQEEFQPENVQDLIENFNNDLHTALNEHFMPKLTENCFWEYSEDKLVDPEWRVISNEEGQIIKFKLITKFKLSDTSYQLKVATIELSEPVDLVEISDVNSENLKLIANSATYTPEYDFAYSIAKQNREPLMNAIFEAKGMGLEKPEGAERFMVDEGEMLNSDLGEIRVFKVTQIEGNQINEFTLRIKRSSSDEGFVELLKDSTKYHFDFEKNIDIQGEAVEYKELIQSIEETIEL